MAHYAELNENNEVIAVLYLDNKTITDENGNEVELLGLHHLHTHHGADRRWVRTSYNGNFRGTYACIGSTYDEEKDVFIPPKPYYHPSWVLNEQNLSWEPPTPMPVEEGFEFIWDDETESWIKYPSPPPSAPNLIMVFDEETQEFIVKEKDVEPNS